MAKKLTIKAQLDKIYKSKLSGKLGTKKRNEAFHALTDEDKRREIALDSLQLLLTSTIIGSRSSYWGNKLVELEDNSTDSKDLQKQVVSLEVDEQCAVCARGAIMLSTVRLGNCLSPFTSGLHGGVESTVQGFTMDNMEHMESSYEYSRWGHPYRSNTDAKLGNILLNVITNGYFDIEDTTDYVLLYKLELDTYPSNTNK